MFRFHQPRLVHEKVKAMFANFTINAHPMAIMALWPSSPGPQSRIGLLDSRKGQIQSLQPVEAGPKMDEARQDKQGQTGLQRSALAIYRPGCCHRRAEFGLQRLALHSATVKILCCFGPVRAKSRVR